MDDESASLDWSTAPAALRKASERQAAQLRDARREVARLQKLVRGTEALHRELVMTKALGDQIDTTAGRTFASTYDGELTAVAVKGAWTDFLAGAIGALAADGVSLHELADRMEPTR